MYKFELFVYTISTKKMGRKEGRIICPCFLADVEIQLYGIFGMLVFPSKGKI